MNQKQIAEIAKLEKSSLHRNLKRLIETRYISRKNFPLIKITPEGKKLVNAIIPEWAKAMTEIKKLLQEAGIEAINIIESKLTKN